MGRVHRLWNWWYKHFMNIRYLMGFSDAFICKNQTYNVWAITNFLSNDKYCMKQCQITIQSYAFVYRIYADELQTIMLVHHCTHQAWIQIWIQIICICSSIEWKSFRCSRLMSIQQVIYPTHDRYSIYVSSEIYLCFDH